MSSFPRISIVVPSYNQAQFLEDTITSILNQDYPNLELFVVDGGSKDHSVEIIKNYEHKINWWVSEKDKGQSDAINKGFKKATGDIITWINSDDLLTEGALHKVADHFSKLPDDVGLIHGGITIFRDEEVIKSDWGYKDPSIERNLAGMAFSQPAAFFKKKYFDQVGGSVSVDLHFGMDYDLYSKLALVCRFVPVREVFAKYRLHDASKTVTEQHKFIEDWARVFFNLCKNLEWIDTINEMKKALGVNDDLDYFKEFSFTPAPQLINKVDKKKLLFYHLCYHVKAFYIANRFNDARKLLQYVHAHYPADWISEERAIPPIIRNLRFPNFVIRFMQRIRNIA